MNLPIIAKSADCKVLSDADIVAARQLGRQIADEIGFGRPDQALIATAISELARNILNYAKVGRIDISELMRGRKRCVPRELRRCFRDRVSEMSRKAAGRSRGRAGHFVGGARYRPDDLSRRWRCRRHPDPAGGGQVVAPCLNSADGGDFGPQLPRNRGAVAPVLPGRRDDPYD